MRKDDCIFCKIANGEIPSTTLYENEDFRVIFDVAPASKGHALVLPKNHFDNVYDMDEMTASKLFVVASKVAKKLRDEVQCDGMNLLQNNGTIAGQTVFHFHMHLIPRYENDTVKMSWTPGEADTESLKKIAQAVSEGMETL